MSPAEIETFIQGIMYHKSGYETSGSLLVNLQILRLNLFKIIFAVEVVLTLFFGLRLIREYNLKVESYYSNIQNKELSVIKLMLNFFVIAALISVVSNFIGKDYFINDPFLIAVPSVTHTIVLFGISYAGYRQDFTIQHFSKDIENDNNAKTNKLPQNFSGNEFDVLYENLNSCI